jgi:hypothetical protein
LPMTTRCGSSRSTASWCERAEGSPRVVRAVRGVVVEHKSVGGRADRSPGTGVRSAGVAQAPVGLCGRGRRRVSSRGCMTSHGIAAPVISVAARDLTTPRAGSRLDFVLSAQVSAERAILGVDMRHP